MNLWKATSFVLVGALAIVVSQDAVTPASAGQEPSSGQSIAYDWGKEQPNMERALKDLEAAKASLKAAAEHKGGWRVAAIKNVEDAIQDTRRGMEYAKNHPHDD